MGQHNGNGASNQHGIRQQKEQLSIASDSFGVPNQIPKQAQSQKRKEESSQQIVKVEYAIIRQVFGVVMVAPHVAHGRLDGPPRHEKEQQNGGHPQDEPTGVHDNIRRMDKASGMGVGLVRR